MKILKEYNPKRKVSNSIKKDVLFVLSLVSLAVLFLAAWEFLRNEKITLFFLEQYTSLLERSTSATENSLKLFSYIGVKSFFIFFLFPVLFWMEEKEKAVKAAMILLIAGATVLLIREATSLPRPYFPELDQTRPGHSFPSGHIVQLLMVLGFLLLHYKKKIVWLLAGLIILFTGISRLFFGHHFLDDIIAGIIIGSLALYFSLRVFSLLESRGFKLLPIFLILLAFIIPFTCLFITQITRHLPLIFYVCGLLGGYTLQNTYFKIPSEKKWTKFYKTFLGIILLTPFAITFNFNLFTDALLLGGYFFIGTFVALIWPSIFYASRKALKF